MPVISNPIPIIIPASLAPNNGDAKTATERTMAKIPTPIRNARDTPECLPEKPSTILAIPLIRNAIPMNMIMVIAAAIGKDIAIPANMRTSTPRPMLDHLDFPGEKMPTIICSIPTKNNTTASIQTIEMKVVAGNAKANIDRTIVITPRPIRAALIQPGDFCTCIVLYRIYSSLQDKSIQKVNSE